MKKMILIAIALAVVAMFLISRRSTDDTPSSGEPDTALVEASWFEDRTASAGVGTPHETRTFENDYAQVMQGYTALGASATVADFDLDGYEDVFYTLSSKHGKNILYRNNGDFTFTDVAEAAGLAEGNDATNASADSLWFDYDNDGDPDLYLVRFGQNLLYENLGTEEGFRFVDVTMDAGLGPNYYNAIVAIAFDYDLDSDLDLFVGNYFAPVNLFDPETPRFFPESFETAANGGGITVYRNELVESGEKRFSDVTDELGFDISGWTLDLGHADADHDGDDDLYVAADFGTDNFYRNNGDGTFTDLSIAAIGVDTKKGMNVDWGDFDNDGLLDIYVTNITDEYMKEGNFLWQNLGNMQFEDVGRETGTYNTGWGWAGKFFDYNNDGWLDLYVVNGWVSGSKDPEDNYVRDIFNVIQDPDVDLSDARNWPAMGDKTLSGYQRNSLFRNEGGIFQDAASLHGLDLELDSRGVALADFDLDGRQDLFVTNSGKAPVLWRNVELTGHHSLSLRLEGRESNRDAIGTRVWIEAGGRPQISYVNGGNGFASQSSRQLHFGIGKAPSVERLVVVWPSGLRQEFENLPADKVYSLLEGEATAFVLTADGQNVIASAEGITQSRMEEGQISAPADLLAHFGAASVFDEAVDEIDALTPAESGGTSFATYSKGMAAFESSDSEGALDLLEAAIWEEPNNLRYGTDYRQVVIALGQDDVKVYERSIAFFDSLVAANPGAANAWLNLGFANVDKVPVEGSITQVLLANAALDHFAKSIEVEDSWLARYSRGNAMLFWPPIFGRTEGGIADVRRAIEIAADSEKVSYHARAWAALGDGHWRLEDLEKAQQTWRDGLERFPGDPELSARLDFADEGELNAFLEARFDTTKRVDSHLREIFYPDSYAVTITEAVDDDGPAGRATGPRFEEVAEAAGAQLIHSTRKFEGHKHQVLEMFTDGGASSAVGDYDDDGDEDIYVTDAGLGKRCLLLRNDTEPGGPIRFTEVGVAAGVGARNDETGIVAEATWFDYDNDGHLDLFVGRFGTPIMYRNLGPEGGEHRFKEVSAEVGLTRHENTVGSIAFDADGDGYLDLMLANYFSSNDLLDLDTTMVLPNNLDYADNGGGVDFYRNVAGPDGSRVFVEQTEQAGLAHHTGWSLDIGHADLDNDGDQDVYVAGDYGTDRLFWGNGDGTFVDGTESGLGGFDTKKGMNVDMGDYNRDGFLDIYVTNITDEYMKECNFFWHNMGDGTFMDLSTENGTCDTDWGWAAKFGDFDNDGWEDLFVVNGLRSRNKDENYIPVLLDNTILKPDVVFADLDSYPDIEDMTWSGYQKQRLFHNLGDETFKEMAGAAGVDNDLDGRGVGVGDFDNDGLLDFYQSNANQPSMLYRGTTENPGNWIELRLVGTTSNRSAIGARATLRLGEAILIREVNGGNGYSSSSSLRLHFGLGEAAAIDALEIRWPSGKVEAIELPALNQIYTVVEGEGVQR